MIRFCDAHNHLQDARLLVTRQEILSHLQARNVTKIVVNGTSEADWPEVLQLARNHSLIIPSIGLHPWFARERNPRWLDQFQRALDSMPCAVGEIGLDQWIAGHDISLQEDIFRAQLEVATERNLPVSIHCLKAWNHLDRILSQTRIPARGFLLHSYSGPAEMIQKFVRLGAYFSLSGRFALPRKKRALELFRSIPPNRLLAETDAPDMCLPEDKDLFQLDDLEGNRINHPGNIEAVYHILSQLLNVSLSELAIALEKNLNCLFGKLF